MKALHRSRGLPLLATSLATGILLASAAATGAGGSDAAAGGKTGVDAGGLPESGEGSGLLEVPALSRGVDSILAQVRERELSLAIREQEVAERERAVAELETLIDERAAELDRIRREVEDRIAAWVSQGQDRVRQLSKVYSEMPADKAGRLLGSLDLDLAVSVIRGMKKKASAGVLAAMRPDRALLVSERILKPLDPKTDPPAAPNP